ncbi:unnamed protein product [Urochloa humidicola]
MEPLVSPPPPAGAPSPTSPTPGSTPDPAATHHAAPANPPTPAPATIPPASSHPNDSSPLPAGKSKVQRWSDNSPESDSSGESAASTRRSYRDVVAASINSAAPSRPSPPTATKPPPRIILKSTVHIPPPARRVRDADGWEQVESRAERRERVELSRRPRRPVPVDLRGRCFNCFSGGHRAAQCKSRTRCFRCRALGHRSLACPGRVPRALGGNPRSAAPAGRVSVWRRITPAAEQVPMESVVSGVASDVPRAEGSGALPPEPERGGRRRRRPRHRRRRANGDSAPTMVAGNGRDASPAPPAMDDGVPPAHSPPCIIDWSAQLTRAEADLRRRAVFVTVAGNIAGLAMDDIKMVVANSFVLNPESLEFRRSCHEHTFIMFMEDEDTIARVTNAGPTPGPGDLQLHCRRWTRQAFAEGVALPVLTNIEFRGVPAHAWEMSSAESLLSPYGWPHLLHPDTRNREDYSVFRVSAWCLNPREIPMARDLHIVEPPVGDILAPPGKPSLKYPIAIRVTDIHQLPDPGSENRSTSDSDDGRGSRRRRQRRASSPSAHDRVIVAASMGRPSVRDGLGPDASGARHVARSVEADGSSSQATCLDPSPIDSAAAGVTAPGSEVKAPEIDACISVQGGFSNPTIGDNLGLEDGLLGLSGGLPEPQALASSPGELVFHNQE